MYIVAREEFINIFYIIIGKLNNMENLDTKPSKIIKIMVQCNKV